MAGVHRKLKTKIKRNRRRLGHAYRERWMTLPYQLPPAHLRTGLCRDEPPAGRAHRGATNVHWIEKRL